jgi:hypothetical protein
LNALTAPPTTQSTALLIGVRTVSMIERIFSEMPPRIAPTPIWTSL